MPYCNLELRSHQRRLTDFAAQGATLVAVSPETPDDTLDTAEKNGLAFPVLSDVGGRLADALGIRFRLSPEIEALYRRFGHDLPARNGDGEWSLPMPATFVVAKGGTITAAFVDPDYRVRLDLGRGARGAGGVVLASQFASGRLMVDASFEMPLPFPVDRGRASAPRRGSRARPWSQRPNALRPG